MPNVLPCCGYRQLLHISSEHGGASTRVRPTSPCAPLRIAQLLLSGQAVEADYVPIGIRVLIIVSKDRSSLNLHWILLSREIRNQKSVSSAATHFMPLRLSPLVRLSVGVNTDTTC